MYSDIVDTHLPQVFISGRRDLLTACGRCGGEGYVLCGNCCDTVDTSVTASRALAASAPSPAATRTPVPELLPAAHL